MLWRQSSPEPAEERWLIHFPMEPAPTFVPAPVSTPRNILDDPIPHCYLSTPLSPFTVGSIQYPGPTRLCHAALLPLQTLTNFPALLWVSSPPAKPCEMNPLASLQDTKAMTPPRPVSPSAPPWLCTTSAPPWSSLRLHRAPLSLQLHLGPSSPWSCPALLGPGHRLSPFSQRCHLRLLGP